MDETAIKDELIDIIEHADMNQLKKIQVLLTNYINAQWSEEGGWDTLPEYQKEKILKSIEEGNAGLVTPAKQVIKLAREGRRSNA